MKSRFLVMIMILGVLPFYTSAQKSQKGKGKASNTSKTASVTDAVSSNSYKHYVGTNASGIKSVLDLHRLDSLVYGNYFDNQIDAYVYLTGTVNKNQAFKLSFTDGRASVAKRKELKNFTITGSFLKSDSIDVTISKSGSEKIALKLGNNYTASLAFDLYYKTNKASAKNKSLEAKYLFTMSNLFPQKNILPITDSIVSDAKKMYFPKKYKQVQVVRMQMVDAVQADELASWKRANQAFVAGKSKNAINTERNERAEVFFNSSDLLCVAYNSYLDNGGMHPNSSETYRNYDIAKKSVIHLNSIFQAGAMPKLPALIGAAFLKDYNTANSKAYSKLSEVGLTDELPLPENFAFNQKGIFFIYNEGELGLSYTGKVSVFIGYNELKVLLDSKCSLAKLF